MSDKVQEIVQLIELPYFWINSLMMEVTTYSSFRRNLKQFMDWVFESSAPLYIKRKGGDDMVLISKSEFDSIQETLHLLRSPKNAERLIEGIKEYRSGGGEVKDLIE